MATYKGFTPRNVYTSATSNRFNTINNTLRMNNVCIVAFRPVKDKESFIIAGHGMRVGIADKDNLVAFSHLIDNERAPRFIVLPIVGEPNAGAWWE